MKAQDAALATAGTTALAGLSNLRTRAKVFQMQTSKEATTMHTTSITIPRPLEGLISRFVRECVENYNGRESQHMPFNSPQGYGYGAGDILTSGMVPDFRDSMAGYEDGSWQHAYSEEGGENGSGA